MSKRKHGFGFKAGKDVISKGNKEKMIHSERTYLPGQIWPGLHRFAHDQIETLG